MQAQNGNAVSPGLDRRRACFPLSIEGIIMDLKNCIVYIIPQVFQFVKPRPLL